MSRLDDIIRLGRKVGLITGYGAREAATDPFMQAFYDAAFKAGAEAEREACANDFEGGDADELFYGTEVADKIRARGTP